MRGPLNSRPKRIPMRYDRVAPRLGLGSENRDENRIESNRTESNRIEPNRTLEAVGPGAIFICSTIV